MSITDNNSNNGLIGIVENNPNSGKVLCLPHVPGAPQSWRDLSSQGRIELCHPFREMEWKELIFYFSSSIFSATGWNPSPGGLFAVISGEFGRVRPLHL